MISGWRSRDAGLLALVAGSCLLSWLLRLHALGQQSLWFDEALSVSQAQGSIPQLVADLAKNDVHPPMYFSLLHFWLLGAGDAEYPLRLLSAGCATLAVAACYALGTRLDGHRTGLLVALGAASSPLLVYYGQETRMYALLALLSALAGYAFLRAADGEGRWWPAYALVQAAALWTQLYASLLFLALNTWYVGVILARIGPAGGRLHWSGWWKRLVPYRTWLVAQVGVIVLFLPWIPVAWGKFQHYTSPGLGSSLGTVLRQTAVVFALGYAVTGAAAPAWLPGRLAGATLALLLCLPLLLTLAAGVIAVARQRRSFLIVWLLLPVAAITIASVGKRDFNARYLMEAAPAAFALSGAGMLWLWHSKVKIAGLLLALALLGANGLTVARIYADPAYARDDNRDAVALIAHDALPGAVVVLDASYMAPAFQYYARGRWPVSHLPAVLPADPSSVTADLAQFSKGRPQVWLVLWQDYYSDPHSTVWNWLLQHFYVADWQDFPGGIKVLRFDALPSTGIDPSGVTFGDTLRLEEYALRAGPAPGTVDLDLYWRAEQRPTTDFSIAAHVIDAAGMPYGNADAPPDFGRLPATSRHTGDLIHTVAQVAFFPWTAPGPYRIQVVVYDPQTLQPLATTGPDAGPGGAMLPITVPATAVAGTTGALPRTATAVHAGVSGLGSLAGYSLAGDGQNVQLTLFWQATARSARPLKVFVHALDAAGRLIVGGDSAPVAGAASTTTWVAGERIRDVHLLTLPAGQRAAAYEVGIYDPATGDRWPISRADGAPAPGAALRLAGPG
jgi:mannosyltransferase